MLLSGCARLAAVCSINENTEIPVFCSLPRVAVIHDSVHYVSVFYILPTVRIFIFSLEKNVQYKNVYYVIY